MAKLWGKRTYITANGAKIDWNDKLLEVAVNRGAAPHLKKAAQQIAAEARTILKERGAKISGDLIKSIKVRKSRFPGGGYVVLVGGKDTYYWYWVHYGKSVKHDQEPTFFMQRALNRVKARGVPGLSRAQKTAKLLGPIDERISF